MNMRVEVVKDGHPALSTVCAEVPHGQDCRALIEHMCDVMRLWGGIGLAANQLDERTRVIVFKRGSDTLAVINPVITRSYGGRSTAREGCLSFPAAGRVLVGRANSVVLEGFDENWKPVKYKLKKLSARCAQHEVDHLNGVTIV